MNRPPLTTQKTVVLKPIDTQPERDEGDEGQGRTSVENCCILQVKTKKGGDGSVDLTHFDHDLPLGTYAGNGCQRTFCDERVTGRLDAHQGGWSGRDACGLA